MKEKLTEFTALNDTPFPETGEEEFPQLRARYLTGTSLPAVYDVIL